MVESNALSASTVGSASGFAVPSVLAGSPSGIAKIVSELASNETSTLLNGEKRFLRFMVGDYFQR